MPPNDSLLSASKLSVEPVLSILMTALAVLESHTKDCDETCVLDSWFFNTKSCVRDDTETCHIQSH
eukprot:1061233-Amphidinium_carterae.1